jgi:hypothetical protein
MIGRNGEDEKLIGEVLDTVTCSEARVFWSDDDVEGAGVELRDQLPDKPGAQGQADTWMVAAKRG